MDEDEVYLRPGTEELRHAIVALPIGAITLIIGIMLMGDRSNEDWTILFVYVGVAALLYGVLRLCQGLYRRV